MKSVLLEVFILLAIAPAIMPSPVQAGSMIFTPGQPAKVVSTFADGYAIYDMGGGSNTHVQHIVSQSTMIRHFGEPTTFIYNKQCTHIELVDLVGPDLGIEVEGFV